MPRMHACIPGMRVQCGSIVRASTVGRGFARHTFCTENVSSGTVLAPCAAFNVFVWMGHTTSSTMSINLPTNAYDLKLLLISIFSKQSDSFYFRRETCGAEIWNPRMPGFIIRSQPGIS